jgi:8-oxo-dGTP pyrophosphatase MutT (NUDIX family)
MDDVAQQSANSNGNSLANISAVILLRADGAALLQHRDDKPGLPRAGMWVFPGGHSDPNESPLDCARREFCEETGYLCENLHWLTSVVDEPDPGYAVNRLHVFWARYDGLQALHCQEGQALEFVPRNQATAALTPEFMIRLWDRALEAFCGDRV